jgi:hypothetical protein
MRKSGTNPATNTQRSEDEIRQIKREARIQSSLERLGTTNPKCVFCSENNPLALEKHHIAGREFRAEEVIVCRNHHRLLSDWQKDHPKKLYEKPHELEVIAHFLAGLADFFELLVRVLREFIRTLTEKADDNAGNTPS